MTELEQLEQAQAQLEQQAGRIPEPATWSAFLENLPWHREIARKWQVERSAKRGV